MRSSIYYAVD